MRRFIVALFAAAFIASGSAFAQSIATKPSCAAGDPVVWVNTNSGVYHMQGDRYYGTTKAGTYLCKSAADAKQYHAASTHGMKGSSSGTMSGAGAMSRASTMPAMAASPDAMASPMGRHHRMRGGMMPNATTAPAAAYPTATATPAGSHRKHRHRQTAPGMSPSEAPAPAAT